MMKHHLIVHFVLSGLLFCSFPAVAAKPAEQEKLNAKEFRKLNELNWKVVFEDPGTGDWERNWHKDGDVATVATGAEGMTVCTGPDPADKTHPVVVWIKDRVFRGDLKIEYDFTRIDENRVNSVNIIYIHATGSGEGPYVQDIFTWNHLRDKAVMNRYFNTMNAYHISYAVEGANTAEGAQAEDYVRGRRYQPTVQKGNRGNEMTPREYEQAGLWETGVTYRMTVIVRGSKLYMHAKGPEKEGLFVFDGSAFPTLTEGYVGLRQQNPRCSRYANFKISELK